MDKAISQKVLEKIREEKISPRSKWEFEAVHFVVLTFLLLFLAMGAFSAGLMLEIAAQFEPGSVIHHPKGLRIIVFSLPYVWITLFAVFAFLAMADFLRTKRGYQYRLRNVVPAFLAVIVLFGFAFWLSGFSARAEGWLEDNFSMYPHLTKTPQNFWHQPERGLLWGMIISNDFECECLKLRDKMMAEWNVDYSEALVRPRVDMSQGVMIKIFGEDRGGMDFEAREIRPYYGNGRRMMMDGGVRRTMAD